MQHRLNHSVHQELVAKDTVSVERIENQIASGCVKAAVSEHHRNVVRRERRQPETGSLVAGVMIVEEKVMPDQAFVHVLRGELFLVVVIPERAQRLAGVAIWRVVREEASILIWIVLVVILARSKVIAGKAIALRRCMAVMQVR